MNMRLLQLLACPVCRGELEARPSGAGEELEEGELFCASCVKGYPVVAGIPRFEAGRSNSRETTAGHFEREFTAFAENDRDIESLEMAEYYFFTRSGLDPVYMSAFQDDYFKTEMEAHESRTADYGSIEGKVVLDAGCGAGRFTRVVGQKADLAVGLELGDHVDRAARLCADLENVEFVQGSVLRPPFKKGIFNLVFSLGVLHHTPDPKQGCLRLADLVSEGGLLSVWVYPPEYWNGPVRGSVARAMNNLVSRLPGSIAHWFCARVLYPVGRIQGVLARRRWSKILLAPVFLLPVPRHPQREIMISTIYDYYGPRLISTHSYPEVEAWFGQAGLAELRSGGLATSCVGTRTTDVLPE
jgi:uncharacterized protein YbaR (Trm112 family)/SAM-dependent methyltransferase